MITRKSFQKEWRLWGYNAHSLHVAAFVGLPMGTFSLTSWMIQILTRNQIPNQIPNGNALPLVLHLFVSVEVLKIFWISADAVSIKERFKFYFFVMWCFSRLQSLLTSPFDNTGLCFTGCYVRQSDLKPVMLWVKIPLLVHYFACELGSKLTEVLF